MLIYRQLFDAPGSTYTYLLGNRGKAMLIDPVFENSPRDPLLLRELDLRLVATLETHVHAVERQFERRVRPSFARDTRQHCAS